MIEISARNDFVHDSPRQVWWGSSEVRPCRGCKYEKWDKNECQYKKDAPCYREPEPIFGLNEYTTTQLYLPEYKTCVICGKEFGQRKTEGNQQYLDRQTCSPTCARKLQFKNKRINVCKFPKCKELVINDYCAYHNNTVRNRKRHGWKKKDLHKPIIYRTKSQRKFCKRCGKAFTIREYHSIERWKKKKYCRECYRLRNFPVITPEIIKEMKAMRKSGIFYRVIGEKYNIGQTAAYNIVNEKGPYKKEQ